MSDVYDPLHAPHPPFNAPPQTVIAGRCATCRHWWQWDTETEGARDQGYCRAAGSYGYVDEVTPLAASDPGTVLTHRIFGCVLHEARG